MAKKQRRNIQELLEKKRQLQAIQKNNSGTLSSSGFSQSDSQNSDSVPDQLTAKGSAFTPRHRQVIGRTLISVLIITTLLIGVAVFERRNDRLDQFGTWLYQALRLAQS